MSLEVLGGLAGVTAAYLSMVENGKRQLNSYRQMTALAEALGVPVTDLMPGMYRQPVPRNTIGVGSFEVSGGEKRGLYDSDVLAMRAFRTADLEAGGGQLYSRVIGYLHSDVAPRLFGVGGKTAESEELFAAAAALTEMAGWMAHDGGSDELAGQHFERSITLAGIGCDRQLQAHILGSMSHLASHVGQHERAVALAQQAQATLDGSSVPGLQARLLALEARGHAASHGSYADCAELLARAEKALGGPAAEAPSPWVSQFDEGSLASEIARCMRQLGDLAEAKRQAERIIAVRPASRRRSRALGQLMLVAVLLDQGKPDEACLVARDVVDSTESLSSYLVIRQLLDLKQRFQAVGSHYGAGGFVRYLDAALTERQWADTGRLHAGPGTSGGSGA